MDYTVHTTTDHWGATVYERWRFPKPSSRQEYVKLEVLEKEMGGQVISDTTVMLDEVPERAREAFLEGARAYAGELSEMIAELEDNECQQ